MIAKCSDATRGRFWGTACLLLGLVAVIGGLSLGPIWVRGIPQVVTPFGSFEFVMVQVIAAMPLAWWLGRRLASGLRVERRVIVGLAMLLGIGSLAGVLGGAGTLSEFCEGTGFSARLFVRAMICVGLVLPWCAAAEALGLGELLGARRTFHSGERFRWIAAGILAVVVAIGLPVMYVDERVPEMTSQTESLMKGERYLTAWRVVSVLCELGSEQPILGCAPTVVDEQLTERVKQLVVSASRPLDGNLSAAERIQRARDMAKLDQMATAEECLGDLIGRDPAAALLLAAIKQQEHDWTASNESCQRAIELVKARATMVNGDELSAIAVQAWEGLITNACRQNNFEVAEKDLAAAVKMLPAAEARLRFALGKQYFAAGRQQKAMRHFEIAGSQSAAYQRQAQAELQFPAQEMSGCIFRLPANLAAKGSVGH
jgi:hypothetical protein